MPILKLQCLNNQDVIEREVSDHDPLLVDTPYGMVCYFNVLCQCVYTSPTKKNNAFNKNETADEYNARLEIIVKVLEELQSTYNIVGFMLQEAPDPISHQNFYKNLEKN